MIEAGECYIMRNKIQFNNDGKKFTITPTDTTNINYIMWNGTDMSSGEKMVQFTLKEVYFTAPAKDYIGINNEILNNKVEIKMNKHDLDNNK